MKGRTSAWAALALTILATLACLKVRLSGDLGRLFPDDAPSRALGDYVRSFGGGDVTTILVRGDDVSEVRLAAEQIAEGARHAPSVKRAITSIGASSSAATQAGIDPTIAWAFADDDARKQLAAALTDDGMRARLQDTRAMLLAPGAGAAASIFASDPLRLLEIVSARAHRVAATVGANESGELVADQGRARFVLLTTEGSSMNAADAHRVIDGLDAAIGAVLPQHPSVRASIAGGVAIARDAEKMIRRDLYLSSALSTLLVALAFVVTFRRPRALIAIGPPLVAGTIWTTSLAVFFPDGIAAIAMGFAAVVIGVGLDTGVHVYAAVLRARRRDPALDDDAVAARALAEVGRPTLTAAIAAGTAFATLALSRLHALRQLGLLCAAGEVLTAIAILAVTPHIAARLERTPPPLVESRALATLGASMTSPRARFVVLGALAAASVALFALGLPRPGSAIVAVKPRGLPALEAQEQAIALASPSNGTGAQHSDMVQLLVLQTAASAQRDDLLSRGEHLRASLLAAHLPDRVVEGLGEWLPSPSTIAARLAERDRLDLPARADALTRAITDVGFSPEALAPALDHLRHPATLATAIGAANRLGEGTLAPVISRFLAHDDSVNAPGHDGLMLATYVRGPHLDPVALAREVEAIDAAAVVSGYPVLEGSLRTALTTDLPRVGIVALLLVALALRTVLKTARDVVIVLAALLAELVIVALVVRVAQIPIHVYDALVLPVLVGITVDESMFLLHAMHDGDAAGETDAPDARDRMIAAVTREGRSIVATATTTAAGFAALLVCRFPGLRDLGAVGLTGTIAGLLASLVVVPALAVALAKPSHVAAPTS